MNQRFAPLNSAKSANAHHQISSLSLPLPSRVLRSCEFRTIYQTGVRMTSRHFSAFCLRLHGVPAASRFGFTIPKAIGGAVDRNRVKRRMKEAVRSQTNVLKANWAIVFNPRRSVLDAPFQDLCREIGRIFARCNHS